MTKLLTLPGIKTPFVLGLSWRHEDSVPKEKGLRALSAQEGRWGLVRKTSTGAIQLAFAHPIAGHKPSKVRSLAAIVAERYPQPWMGLYELGNGLFWYIAVRDGQEVIPNGDIVGSIEEIQPIQNAHRAYGNWREISGDLDDLVGIAKQPSRGATLKDMQVSSGKQALILGGSVFSVGAIALIGWSTYQHQQQKKEEELAAIRAASQAVHTKLPPAPWTSAPMPSDLLTACGAAWSNNQTLSNLGWILSGWTCSSKSDAISLTTHWTRAGGLAIDAPGVLATSGNESDLSVTFPSGFQTPKQEPVDTESARRALWTMTQRYALKLELRESAYGSPVLPGTVSSAADLPWKTTGATFSSIAPPWLFLAPAFDSVPGLRIDSLNWSVSQPTRWTIVGSLYSRRPETHAGASRPLEHGEMQP